MTALAREGTDRVRLLRRGLRLEGLTIAWNVVEAASSILFGWLAGSVALVAFGLDSVIEVIAATALFARLWAEAQGGDSEDAERRERGALRVVAWTFFALAAYVVIDGAWSLLGHRTPEKSFGGIAVSALALTVMPALGTVLLGVGLNALLGWWWADPVAALVLVPFLVHEGREAMEHAHGSDEDDDEP